MDFVFNIFKNRFAIKELIQFGNKYFKKANEVI